MNQMEYYKSLGLPAMRVDPSLLQGYNYLADRINCFYSSTYNSAQKMALNKQLMNKQVEYSNLLQCYSLYLWFTYQSFCSLAFLPNPHNISTQNFSSNIINWYKDFSVTSIMFRHCQNSNKSHHSLQSYFQVLCALPYNLIYAYGIDWPMFLKLMSSFSWIHSQITFLMTNLVRCVHMLGF